MLSAGDPQDQIRFIQHQQEEQLAKERAEKNHLPYVNLFLIAANLDALYAVEDTVAFGLNAIPFQIDGKRLSLAAVDPQNQELQKLRDKLSDQGYEVRLFVCSQRSFNIVAERYKNLPPKEKISYKEVAVSAKIIEKVSKTANSITSLKKIIAEQQNISQLLEVVIGAALGFDASDVHFEPQRESVLLRFRLDGILYDADNIDPKTYNLLLSRIKLISGMKLNVGISQDGRFSVVLENKEIEVRVSVAPAAYGETIVLRVLNPTMLLSIEDLGFHDWLQNTLSQELRKPNGIILVCGPTGSGKTTTLYAFLSRLMTPEIKIITIENPIEYHIKGVSQTQVNDESGYTFPIALKTALRQDPDIILVGEIRDRDTAETATQAALTGHLVFSTLHTNSAAGAVPRLIELGVSGNSLSSAINVIFSQRLIRKVCPFCKELIEIPADIKSKIQKQIDALTNKNIKEKYSNLLSNAKMPISKGCPKCNSTGYKGRLAIAELFQNTPALHSLISAYPSVDVIEKTAREEGMVPLQTDGVLRIIEGITTVDEVERITGPLG